MSGLPNRITALPSPFHKSAGQFLGLVNRFFQNTEGKIFRVWLLYLKLIFFSVPSQGARFPGFLQCYPTFLECESGVPRPHDGCVESKPFKDRRVFPALLGPTW